jgi:hypothetical protein
VPVLTTNQSRPAVIQIYDTDETGVVPESKFAESDPFPISAPTGVDAGESTPALRPASLVPVPSR